MSSAAATGSGTPDGSSEATIALGGGPVSRDDLLAARLLSAPRPARLDRPLTDLRGVGPKLAAAAERIGLRTLGDLIEHYPHDYGDRSSATEIADLRLDRQATVIVTVRTARLRPTRRRNLFIVEATVADGSAPMNVTWFNQAWLADRLKPGVRMLLSGRLTGSGFRPDAYEILGAETAGARGRDPIRDQPGPPTGLHTTGIVPIHPSGEGLRVQKIREWVWAALRLAPDALEPLPSEVRARRRLPGAADARVAIHFPTSTEAAARARRRLAYEELFLHQAALQVRRGERRSALTAAALGAPGELVGGWLDQLPFEPTADQLGAFDELDADLASTRPMQRLLMGEVGSGKTVVALYAMLRALEAGRQAALMAPTETLAEQHFATLEQLLAGSGTPIGLLTGSTPAGRRRELLARLETGELPLVVGTHALIEPTVRFARLAVAVVDEQHRFGVEFDSSGTCLVAGRPIRAADGEVRGLGRIVVRPERVQLVDGAADGHTNALPGVARDRVYVGALSHLEIGLADGRALQVVLANDGRPVPGPGGEPVTVSLPRRHPHHDRLTFAPPRPPPRAPGRAVRPFAARRPPTPPAPAPRRPPPRRLRACPAPSRPCPRRPPRAARRAPTPPAPLHGGSP